jgi:signal transduction histidine kinase
MKSRIVWAIGGVAAIAIILFGIPLAVALQRTYRDEELLRLQRDTIAATRSIDTAASASDRPELPRFGGHVAVYGRTLARLAGSGPPRGDAPVRQAAASRAPQRTTSSGRLIVAIPLFRGERIAGVVRGERSQAAVAARAHSAWLRLGAVAAALIASAVLAAFALGRRLASPLESLAAVARRIGAGDFAARAPGSVITEIDTLATALNASSQRIAELVAREREFSVNASHQLRTALAALRLELEAGLLEHPDDRTLGGALGQAERLETTIATLLAHAHAHAHAHDDDRPTRDRRADLGALVERLRERWHGQLAAAGRPLRITAPHPAPTALIAPAVLDEILDVLMDNALRHGAGAVNVSVRNTREALAIDVTDHGRGFSGNPERAFERGVGAGNGIGLALARSLAHAEGALLAVTRSGPHPTLTLLVAPGAAKQPAKGPSPLAGQELRS